MQRVDCPLFLVSAIWGGFSQSLFREKAIKELGDAETRDNACKTITRVRRWETLINKWFNQQCKRNALRSSLMLLAPPADAVDAFFNHGSARDDASARLMKGISDDKTWDTRSPATVKRSYGEMSLMVRAYEARSQKLVEDAWATWFLPENSVIVERTAESTPECRAGGFL